MNKLLSALAAGLSLSVASAADYTLHSFQKILVTTNFLCEGADFADFNKDGKKDVVAGPYLFLGPDFKQRVEYTPPAAKPYDPAKGDQGPGAAYNGGAKFYTVYDGDTAKQHDLRISHIGYDRKHTTATDSGTWFPLPQFLKAAAAGRILPPGWRRSPGAVRPCRASRGSSRVRP